MVVPMLLAVAALCVFFGAWLGAGAPGSVAEWCFQQRLAELTAARPAEIELAALMSGDWERVCESHCYDGFELYLPQYQREYPAVACGDGDWGLLFISADGSYEAASRPLTRECVAALDLNRNVCLLRSNATLLRGENSEGCPVYRAAPPPEGRPLRTPPPGFVPPRPAGARAAARTASR